MLKALIMGLVEGITEFLPISSTGHLIITGEVLGFLEKDVRGVFEIFIQLGAILAICWEYRKRLTDTLVGLGSDAGARRFAINVALAFCPAVVLGLLFSSKIKAHLFAPVPVSSAFVVGGLIILAVERRNHTPRVEDVDAMTWKDALKVGLAQCFALIPGTSRSGSTIIGGLLFGLSRKAATEFSFFLAIPTLTGAAFYDLYKNWEVLDVSHIGYFAMGFFAAFVSALFAVRGLLRYISNHDFTLFAWYRIGFGILILTTAYTGIVSWHG